MDGTPLHLACIDRDLPLLHQNLHLCLLEQDSSGRLPLHSAVATCFLEGVQVLLSSATSPVQLSTRDNIGRTPLHLIFYRLLACRSGPRRREWEKLATYMLMSSTDANRRLTDSFGFSVYQLDVISRGDLFTACRSGNLDRLKFVLSVYQIDPATIQLAHLKRTLLHEASEQSQNKVIQYLLRQNVPINVQDTSGYTPLDYCIVRGNMIGCLMLFKSDASTNISTRNGKTPLHLSVEHHQFSIFRHLLPVNDINATDISGCTPLYFAVACGCDLCVECASDLIQHGAAINPFDINVRSCDLTASWAPCGRLFHAKGCEKYGGRCKVCVNDQINVIEYKTTPSILIAAIRGKNPMIVQLLIDYGADPNVSSPLAAAISIQSPEIVRILLNSGATYQYPELVALTTCCVQLEEEMNRDPENILHQLSKFVDFNSIFVQEPRLLQHPHICRLVFPFLNNWNGILHGLGQYENLEGFQLAMEYGALEQERDLPSLFKTVIEFRGKNKVNQETIALLILDNLSSCVSNSELVRISLAHGLDVVSLRLIEMLEKIETKDLRLIRNLSQLKVAWKKRKCLSTDETDRILRGFTGNWNHVEHWLECYGDLRYIDSAGRSLPMLAIISNHPDAALEMLDHLSPCNHHDVKNRSLLDYAVRYKYESMAQNLVQSYQMEVTAETIVAAIKSKDASLSQFVLGAAEKRNFNFGSFKDCDGNTLLDLASLYGNITALNFLLGSSEKNQCTIS